MYENDKIYRKKLYCFLFLLTKKWFCNKYYIYLMKLILRFISYNYESLIFPQKKVTKLKFNFKYNCSIFASL